MGKRQKTQEQEIQELCNDIRQEIAHWEDLNENGGQDPFWPDGVNMNLIRNHVIYAKQRLAEICNKHGIQLPGEMYLPIPPEVNSNYMASMQKKERVNRLRQRGDELTTKRNKYDAEQLSLF